METSEKKIESISTKHSDKVIIRMSDFYPDHIGEKEFCEVSKEVYECLVKEKRAWKSKIRQQERYEYCSNIDENKLGEMCGVYSESAESIVMRNELLRSVYEAMDMINHDFSRRFYLKAVLGRSVSEIARSEGISQPAVSLSINKAERMIKKILEDKGLMM